MTPVMIAFYCTVTFFFFFFQQLHSSVRTNNLETVLRLISKGADPNYLHPEKGNCPLHVAAGSGQLLQIELLVIYGADPGALDVNGKTPIDHARYVYGEKRKVIVCRGNGHVGTAV